MSSLPFCWPCASTSSNRHAAHLLTVAAAARYSRHFEVSQTATAARNRTYPNACICWNTAIVWIGVLNALTHILLV
eukprot:1610-Heterococcus_DN1.PRE.3